MSEEGPQKSAASSTEQPACTGEQREPAPTTRQAESDSRMCFKDPAPSMPSGPDESWIVKGTISTAEPCDPPRQCTDKNSSIIAAKKSSVTTRSSRCNSPKLSWGSTKDTKVSSVGSIDNDEEENRNKNDEAVAIEVIQEPARKSSTQCAPSFVPLSARPFSDLQEPQQPSTQSSRRSSEAKVFSCGEAYKSKDNSLRQSSEPTPASKRSAIPLPSNVGSMERPSSEPCVSPPTPPKEPDQKRLEVSAKASSQSACSKVSQAAAAVVESTVKVLESFVACGEDNKKPLKKKKKKTTSKGSKSPSSSSSSSSDDKKCDSPRKSSKRKSSCGSKSSLRSSTASNMRDSALKKEFSEKCSPGKSSKASRKSSSSKSDSKCSDKPTKDKKLCDDDTAAQHTAVEDTAKSVESIKSHKSLKSNEDVKTPRKSLSKEESKSSEKSKDKKLCDDATAAPTAAVEENAKSFESVKSGKSKKNSAEDIKVSWVAKSQDSNEDEKKRKSGESLLDRDPLATLHQNVTMFLVGGKVPQHPTETGIGNYL